MPELPEVETITTKLKENAEGSTILDVKVENPKIIAYPEVEEFIEKLRNHLIKSVYRRGKFINLELSDDLMLIAHMRMTGRLYVVSPEEELEKHTHLILGLSNNKSLRFVDPRRFGRFWLVNKDEAESISGMDKLGIEPLSEDLSPEYLRERIGKRKKAIKSLLIDQNIVCGIGNIYADEILHRAKIYPGKKACELTDLELENLSKAIPEIILENLEECLSQVDEKLTSLLDYRSSKTITTYNHQGKPCPTCGEELKKIKINGRSTCYCPECQKK